MFDFLGGALMPGELPDGDDLTRAAEWLLTLPAEVAAPYLERLQELADTVVEFDDGMADNFEELMSELLQSTTDAGVELLEPINELADTGESISWAAALIVAVIVGAIVLKV